MVTVSSVQKLTYTKEGYRPYLTIRYLREHTVRWANYGGWHAGCTCGFRAVATGEINANMKALRHLRIANSQLVQSRIFKENE